MFPASSGGAKKMAEELNVLYLGSLPLDPKLGQSCDNGVSFLAESSQSPAAKALDLIIKGRTKFNKFLLLVFCMLWL
jgi:NUBPL iron-transfer P-loop NTPase